MSLFTVTHQLSPGMERLLHAQSPEILAAISKMEGNIMSALTDLSASFEKFITDVAAYKANVAQQIADAVAAAEAGETVDLKALQAKVDAADADLMTPVVPPTAPAPVEPPAAA